MSHFCLLRDPTGYVANDWDLLADHSARAYWLDLFQKQFAETEKHSAIQYGRKIGKQAAAAQQQFNQAIEALRAAPGGLASGTLNVAQLYRLREKALRDQGLGDSFGYLKDRENRAALQLYGPLVRKLRGLPAAQKWLQVIQGVFAGESFDLGAAPAVPGKPAADFSAAIQKVKPRPWLTDDYDRLATDLVGGPPAKWSKAIFFIDKAGGDFVLGVMPLARELGLAGAKIVLAANERPCLNDLTADGAAAAVEQLAQVDDDLASLISGGMIEVVSTGSDIPLLDLSDVSDELNEAAVGADLVVLLGTGRAVQSNQAATFTVDALKLTLLKDPAVAQRLGGTPMDCVCKYEPV
jgi:type II pantothenate kinase